MTPEIEEAIEAACSAGASRASAFKPIRRASPERVHAIVKEFLRQVPEGITVQELLDEL